MVDGYLLADPPKGDLFLLKTALLQSFRRGSRRKPLKADKTQTKRRQTTEGKSSQMAHFSPCQA